MGDVRMNAPDEVGKGDVWGYLSKYNSSLKLGKDKTESGVEQKRQFVVFNNILNGLSYILSPIIGLVRIIAMSILRYCDEDKGTKKEYYNMQIARGLIELVGGGFLAWIPDIITSIPSVREKLQGDLTAC